jgi:hypothetical protein
VNSIAAIAHDQRHLRAHAADPGRVAVGGRVTGVRRLDDRRRDTYHQPGGGSDEHQRQGSAYRGGVGREDPRLVVRASQEGHEQYDLEGDAGAAQQAP